jgi:hypothetical protein
MRGARERGDVLYGGERAGKRESEHAKERTREKDSAREKEGTREGVDGAESMRGQASGEALRENEIGEVRSHT